MNSIDNSTTITTIKLSEFEKLLKSKDWTHSYEVSVMDTYETEIEDDEGKMQPITCVYGCGIVKSRLGNITITYTEGYEYIVGDKESFQCSCQGLGPEAPQVADWITVVDEDDEEEINLEWVKFPREFSWVDYELTKASI